MDSHRDFGQDKELAKQFLRDFTSVDNETGEPIAKYGEQLKALANREKVHMLIELADVEVFNNDLATQITRNTVRYTNIFYEALDEILPSYKTRDPAVKDIMDIFIEQRLCIAERNQRSHQNASAPTGGTSSQMSSHMVNIEGKYPPDLIRRAEISFKPAYTQSVPIREVKADCIGQLVTVRGIVTRTTDVKPKVTIATYTCDQCGCETFQPVKGLEYTPLFECTSSVCQANKALGKTTAQIRGSKLIKFQEIKLQEHSDHVPTGNIPRTITVMAHGELTRLCTAGDHIAVSGVFLTIEKTAYRVRTGGLAADTYLEAHHIVQMNKTEDDELDNQPMTAQEARELIGGGNDFLNKLSSSIAPEIYGHDNLKKALLLLLVGGVDKAASGMKIRGNINICLMGDPGVAKSQLLGFIDRLAPRSQYTTGRGSSGVGLTAAVLKDPITNELILEGGALVLADEGICCIDEFDKMLDADRTAIHEVMEQQTVSIAKAGIMTTLNARVSILAAANPVWGRYDIRRSITDNLNLPPALLSRFDLLWLIRDQPEKQKDLSLASHITNIHQNPTEPQLHDADAIDMKVMRRYINLCKLKNPIVPEQLDERLIRIYLDIRSRRRTKSSDDTLFTSPRCMLAIIRLATAFARLRLADAVEEADIDAAVHLYNCSRDSIENPKDTEQSVARNVLSMINQMIKSSGSRNTTVPISSILETSVSEGLNKDQVYTALDKLSQMDVLFYDDSEVTLVQ